MMIGKEDQYSQDRLCCHLLISTASLLTQNNDTYKIRQSVKNKFFGTEIQLLHTDWKYNGTLLKKGHCNKKLHGSLTKLQFHS